MANIWSLSFAVKLIIFAQVFNWKIVSVSALTNVDKGQCIGKYKFGIDRFAQVKYSEMIIKFNNFDKSPTESTMENNGHVLKIELNYIDVVPTVEVDFSASLGVVGTFRLKYLYFQWLKKAPPAFHYKNISFPAELHAVFYDVNAKDYDHAVTSKHGVIVLAFSFAVNPEYNSFIFLKDNLKYVRQANSKAPIENVDLNNWFRSLNTTEILIYEGSFLEYPCQGTVVWIDVINFLITTPETVEEFQKLKANEVNPLMGEVSEISKPKEIVFHNYKGTNQSKAKESKPKQSKAKKTNLAMPRLIIGVVFMIFSSY